MAEKKRKDDVKGNVHRARPGGPSGAEGRRPDIVVSPGRSARSVRRPGFGVDPHSRESRSDDCVIS